MILERNGYRYHAPKIMHEAAAAAGVDFFDFLDGFKAALSRRNMQIAWTLAFTEPLADRLNVSTDQAHRALLAALRSMRVIKL